MWGIFLCLTLPYTIVKFGPVHPLTFFNAEDRVVSTSSPRWRSARKDIRNILIRQARKGRERPACFVCYSDLLHRVFQHQLPAQDHIVNALLIEIATDEARYGRGMLSALVLQKLGDALPPPIFFDVAGTLGRNTSDRWECWQLELEKVVNHWSNIILIH
jgi:hypothetical protein